MAVDESGRLGSEGSLNWELFSPKGNRFYLPGSLGPAWHSATTTIYADVDLDDLIDFESQSRDKLHISSQECPQLLRENLPEVFPAPEVASKTTPLTMIGLASANKLESEKAAKIVSIQTKMPLIGFHNMLLSFLYSLFWQVARSAPD